MSKIDEGGAAFPFAATDPSNVERQTNGMTLRDWFAGQALAGIIASSNFISPDGLWCGNGAAPTADAAYLLTDAIPTKDANLTRLSLDAIATHVAIFIEFALCHPELQFEVTAIGCGLAGYEPKDIAWMFDLPAPKNVHLPEQFLDVLRNGATQ